MNLSAIAGGGVNAVHTGFVEPTVRTNTGTASLGDSSYLDVDVTSLGLSDTSKCLVLFDGVFSSINVAYVSSTTQNVALATARLTSTTNLRIQSDLDSGVYYFVGRWTVVEYS